MDEEGKKHTFIQILDDKKETAKYIKFDAETFLTSSSKFEVSIHDNHFNS